MDQRRANGDLISLALIVVLGLLTTAVILLSATGGERTSVGIVALVLSPSTIIVGLLLIGYQRYRKSRLSSAIGVTIACLTIIASVAFTHWPLRITYALSRNSFNAVAQRIRTGEQIKTPMRAGLFTIQRAELSHLGIVCLWIEPNPSGSTGFVQCRRDYVPFNLWSIIKLDEHWQFISED